MDDRQLQRYSRHLLLPELGPEGQERLLGARVLLVGAGGLGSPAALYLAASGVGELRIADPDRVELDNLQRQIAHGTADLGRPKARSAAESARALNPEVRVLALEERAEGERLAAWVAEADLALDASDNFPTRYALNEACLAAGRPLVSGAVAGWRGQVAVFAPGHGGCYRCLYPQEEAAEETTCAAQGVLSPAAGAVGCLMAVEALKVLLGLETALQGRLLQADLLTQRWRVTRIPRDPACPCARSR